MKPAGENYLEKLGRFPPDTFERCFSSDSSRLGLGSILDRNELTLLYEASFRAHLCYLAINGISAVGGQIHAEDEQNRRRLEYEFMTAREIFYASPGWQTLPAVEQESVEQVFLSVFVTEDKLAR